MNRVLFVIANMMALATHAAAFLLVAAFVAVAAYPDSSLVRQCFKWLSGV